MGKVIYVGVMTINSPKFWHGGFGLERKIDEGVLKVLKLHSRMVPRFHEIECDIKKILQSLERHVLISVNHDETVITEKLQVLKIKVLASAAYITDQFKADLVSSLRLHLRYDLFLSKNVASILEALTENFTELPLDTGLALIEDISYLITKHGCVFTDYHDILLQIVFNLILTKEEYQDIIRTTKFLKYILNLLCNLNFENRTDETILISIMNVVILSAKNNRNLFTISELITPLVLMKLMEWIENPSNSKVDGCMLKNLLFLLREVMSSFAICQEIFLKNKGIEVLVRVLEEADLMIEEMDIYFTEPSLDCARTLFSGILCLLDTAVTHNSKVCQKTKMQVLSILKEYLLITPADQKGFLISCCVHILEGEVTCPDIKMVHDLYNIATTLDRKHTAYICCDDIKKFLLSLLPQNQRITNKSKKILGTPHPCRSKKAGLALAKKLSVTDYPASLSQPRQDMILSQPQLDQVKSTAVQSSQKVKCFLSSAELSVFMNCVRLYGINMKAIRKVYPFHKDLTPGDLYVVWKALWKRRQ